VSKTKPIAAVEDVYGAGHRHFGENYVQELVEKAPRLPSDIRWHFIGQLQSNKAKVLVSSVPNLWAVESVDSSKLAGLLNKAAEAAGRSEPLRVFVQVNTSAETQKGGVAPGDETMALARYVVESCPALRLVGLMTIGRLGDVARVYFERLQEQRDAVLAALAAAGIEPGRFGPLPGGAPAAGGAGAASGTAEASTHSGRGCESGSLEASGASAGAGLPAPSASGHASLPQGALELSMGMSGDFELAIECGSTNVRVGSSIFGAREYAGHKAAAEASEAAARAAEAAVEAEHHSQLAGEGAPVAAGSGHPTAAAAAVSR
jgi:pyridoxal phosphate enzyme (YggS family)